MLLKEVRNEDANHKKLLCKLHIEEDSLYVSIKGRQCKESTNIDVCEMIEPYIDKKSKYQLKRIFNLAYQRKKDEIQN